MKRLLFVCLALLLAPAPASATSLVRLNGSYTVGVPCTLADGSSFVCPATTQVDSSGTAAGTAANPIVVTGNVASAATDSGNPVKVGGIYSSTLPTFTTGQRGDLQLGPRGTVRVSLFADGGTAGPNMAGASDGVSFGTTFLYSYSLLAANNGTTGDSLRTIGGQAAAGTASGVLAVEQAGASFSNITTATTTTVKSGKGILHKLIVNTQVASATITIYDNTTASGTKIGILTLPATTTGPLSINYDLAFGTGLTLVTSGATDLTVVYR